MDYVKIRIKQILEEIDYLQDKQVLILGSDNLSTEEKDRQLYNVDIDLICWYKILKTYTKHLMHDIED